jgi:hypothetical protein
MTAKPLNNGRIVRETVVRSKFENGAIGEVIGRQTVQGRSKVSIAVTCS